MLEMDIQDQLSPWLRRKARSIRSFRKPLARSQALMLRSVDTNFRRGGRPAWKPLRPSTVANRRQRSSRPLQDRGHLRMSIRPGPVSDFSTSLGPFGTPLRYARVHQEGATIRVPEITPRRKQALRFRTADGQVVFTKRTRAHTVKIPARPFMVFQQQDQDNIVELHIRHIEEA